MSTRNRGRLILLGSFLFSQLALFLILRMPPIPGEGSWLKAFRAYFDYDQLSYAGIASTTAAGVGGLPEPFTETGHSYYPSLWYRILGWLAALTGQSVPTVWTVAGYLLLAFAVAYIGWVAWRISGLAWGPALVGPALAIGTLSVALHDHWYTTLDSHAVVWGPYGALYVLNGEDAGFACLGIALATILRVAVGPRMRPVGTIVWLSIAAILIGVTANVHTYIFLLGSAVAFAWLGAYGLLKSRSRTLAITTAGLVAATFIVGPFMAGVVGALPVFGLLVISTLPGVIWIARQHVRVLIAPAILFVLVALPQVALVASGYLAKDEFLVYRQDQSANLGVPLWIALIVSLPIASVWVFNFAVQRTSRNHGILAALLGLAFAGFMMSFNGWWGFGQEPYRLWIDSVTVAALLLAPISAWSVANWQRQEEPRSRLIPATAVAVVVLVGLSFLDFGAFRVYVRDSGVIRFDTARVAAIASVSAQADGLMTSGPCIDPQELKIITRKPVAYYNLGIAWPENRGAIQAVMDAQRNGTFDPDLIRAAKVQYIVTDSSCPTVWPVDKTMGVAKIGSVDYSDEAGAGTISLYRIV